MKVHGIKKAVGEYNRWTGHAEIMYDTSDDSVWTNIFVSCDSFKVYQSDSIVRVTSKGSMSMSSGRNKITMREVEDRIRYCRSCGHSWI